MKINNFRVDLTDISARKEPLMERFSLCRVSLDWVQQCQVYPRRSVSIKVCREDLLQLGESVNNLSVEAAPSSPVSVDTISASFLAEMPLRSARKLFIFII